MKLSFTFELAAIATMTTSAIASKFGEFAVPFNYEQYRLAIIEQMSG